MPVPIHAHNNINYFRIKNKYTANARQRHSNDVKKSGKSLLSDDFFSFIDLFHEKRQAMYGSTSYQHRADPNVPAEEVASTVAGLTNEGEV